MNHSEFASTVLMTLRNPPADVPTISTEEGRQNNTARCMSQLFRNRLSTHGEVPERIRRATYRWSGGVFALRNARIIDHHWSTLQLNVAEQLHQDAESTPIAYVLTYWAISDAKLHVWVVPEDVAYRAFEELPAGKNGTHKTVELFPDTHLLKNAPNAPDLSPYYLQLTLRGEEVTKLAEAIKVDHAAKRAQQNSADVDNSEDDLIDETQPFFTAATIEFVKELPEHTEDGKWHEANRVRYQQVLRDPTRSVVEALRDKYIERLSPEVAGGKHQVSILKKNDYGKGGYHDHYWFAFYDPNAGSRTRSAQLYLTMKGSEQVWQYGFSMGNYCNEYVERLQLAIQARIDAAASYVRKAPTGTIVRLVAGDNELRMTPDEFATRIQSASDPPFQLDAKLTSIDVMREYPLETLADHDESLIDEVGGYFTWAWPFFEASMNGEWPVSAPLAIAQKAVEAAAEEDVDDEAPSTLGELSELTSLKESLLDELEQSLLAKQQVVLVGPPGTSKTYVARQFARYFVRQRPGRPQGSYHVLYMHANWTYEDFFEGIKPSASKEGALTFQQQKGFLLEWVDQLKTFDTSARHVLVLDEINRCDTAAVLGELLQLLEYRGTTVRLLSGRQFVFPRNLFIIGTMNSADRSIGRMDLALRRRFLWLNLYPQPNALQRWLDRIGNNPVGFKASSLEACNELLANRGIPKEQHIGHALFMVQDSDTDVETGMPQDTPLTENHLRRIVQFSVVPYVRELFTAQFGQLDEEIVNTLCANLLRCIDEAGESKQKTTANES